MLALVVHWVGCAWFFIGWLSIRLNQQEGSVLEAISSHGSLRSLADFSDFPNAES